MIFLVLSCFVSVKRLYGQSVIHFCFYSCNLPASKDCMDNLKVQEMVLREQEQQRSEGG